MQPPEIEHRNAIGQITHHVQIMRDEHVAHAAFALQVGEQIEDRACTETSSAEVGSSQTTTRGSPANARAIATRCLRPPDNCRVREPEITFGQAHGGDERGKPLVLRRAAQRGEASTARGQSAV